MSARIFRYTCLVLGLAILAFTIWTHASLTARYTNSENENLKRSQKNVLNMAIKINDSVSQIVDATRHVANDLSDGKLAYEDVEQRLTEEGTNISGMLQAIGVAYEPDALDSTARSHSHYYVRDAQGHFSMIQLGQIFDPPTSGQDTWYARLSELQGTWSETGNDIQNEVQVMYYALPFTRWDRTQLKEVPAGVVFAALSLDDLQQLVKKLDLGDEGYAFIVSGDGNYLVHPNQSLINSSMADNKDLNLTGDFAHATGGELYKRDGISGNRPSWYFYEPIPAAGWSVGIVLQKDPHNELVIEQKQGWVETGLLLILSLTLIAVFVFNMRLESLASMWAVSISVTVLMVGVIVMVWILEITYPSTLNSVVPAAASAPNSCIIDSSTILSNHAVLDMDLGCIDKRFASNGATSPIRIPTGIFIENFSIDGRSLNFTGYVWQKYPAQLVTQESPPEVIFLDAQSQDLRLAYWIEEKDTVVIGHYFNVSQMQTFSSNKYPLDLATISLQLQAESLDMNYLLVPDLDSYYGTNPSAKPGIKADLLLNNWDVVSSAFTYDNKPRDMDFGSTSIKQYNLPILQFDIALKRFIVPSLLSYGITAMVTAILMFSLILSKAENLRSVLTESFALFFVLVVAHVSLRGELASQGIVYLETLFISLYCLILLGVLNGLIQFVNFKILLFSYQDGLLFKLLYWPILFGVFLIVSLRLFYPHIFG